ncbi:MAG: hypothetical protein EON59_12615 [Alphaproteobacteria bacterium]|nr:MAG: hypothetical protein EON59_12615 [Alphaproteobacteria bacterium]
MATATGAAAQDAAYCAIISGSGYSAESRLREARCFKDSDTDGVQSYLCEDDGSRAAQFRGGWYLFRYHGEGAFVPQAQTRACGSRPSPSYVQWNNPLITDIHSVGTTTVAVLKMGIPTPERPDQGDVIYVIGDSIGIVERLRMLPDFPEEGGLSFPSSEVRISGTDIVSATPAALLSALEARGAEIRSHECRAPEGFSINACNSGAFTTSFPEGEVQGSGIEVEIALSRVAVVKYIFESETHYTSFVQALDGRYGSSTRQSDPGRCTRRYWSSGSIRIVGRYCGDNGATIQFINKPLVDMWGYYLKQIRSGLDGTAEENPPPPRPRGDMF